MVKIKWICTEQTGEVLHKDLFLCSLISLPISLYLRLLETPAFYQKEMSLL